MKQWFENIKGRVVAGLLVAVVMMATNPSLTITIPKMSDGYPPQIVGQYRFVTIGNPAHATGAIDYPTDGSNDNVEAAAAISEVNSHGGGEVFFLTDNFSWANGITVNVPANITIRGTGSATYFDGDGVTAIFTSTGDNTSYQNIQTDAGGIATGSTAGWVQYNVTIGTTYYGARTPTTTTGASWAIPTGRESTYLVAASNAPAVIKAQADYVADGTGDQVEIQAAINALPAGPSGGGTVFLSPGTFYISSNITINTSGGSPRVIGSGMLATQLTQTAANITTFDLRGASTFLTIQDMDLYGGAIATGTGKGITTTGVNVYDLNLRNLFIRNHASTGVDTSSTSWGHVYDNIIVEFNKGVGVIVNGNAKITNSKFGGNSVAADRTLLNISSQSIVIGNEFFAWGGTGAGEETVKIQASGNIFTGNTFFNINSGAAGRRTIGISGDANVVTNNLFYNVIQTYGIYEETGATNSIIMGNSDKGSTWGSAFIRRVLATNGSMITRNKSGTYKTENSGTGNITSGTTSIIIAHGLTAGTYGFSITPSNNTTNAVSHVWATINSTNLTVNVNTDPGASGLQFYWRAWSGEGN